VDRNGPWCSDFVFEAGWVRRKWVQCRDAPPLSDAQVVIPFAYTLKQWRQQNLAYRRSLQARIDLGTDWDPAPLWDALRAAERLDHLFERAETAGNPRMLWAERRLALKELYDLLGPASYYQAVYPSPVPARRID
jgi:hypothetical protein